MPRSFRHVLAAVDLSSRSRHTVHHAAEIAAAAQACLTLLHVRPRDRYTGALSMPEVPVPEPFSAADDDWTVNSLEAPASLVRDLRLPASTRVALVAGVAEEEVARYAEEHGADLVVVGTRRRRGLERLLADSVGESIALGTSASVIAVPSADDEARRPPANGSEVVCAIDLSASSRDTLARARVLAAERHAHLTVIHCMEAWHWDDPWPLARGDESAVREALSQDAQARMEALLEADPETDVRVDTRVLFGSAEEEILRAAAARAADLLILGAHSRSGPGSPRDRRLGPTALHVMRQAPCPVLLVRGASVPTASPFPRLSEPAVVG